GFGWCLRGRWATMGGRVGGHGRHGSPPLRLCTLAPTDGRRIGVAGKASRGPTFGRGGRRCAVGRLHAPRVHADSLIAEDRPAATAERGDRSPDVIFDPIHEER